MKAQFLLVTFTLSGKNMVIQSQLNRTESALSILYLNSVKKSDISGPFLQQKSVFAFYFYLRPTVNV